VLKQQRLSPMPGQRNRSVVGVGPNSTLRRSSAGQGSRPKSINSDLPVTQELIRLISVPGRSTEEQAQWRQQQIEQLLEDDFRSPMQAVQRIGQYGRLEVKDQHLRARRALLNTKEFEVRRERLDELYRERAKQLRERKLGRVAD
jgi:hypothetical protein